MKKGGGKSKGAGFEREICRKLSLWLSKGEKTDLLWRSAMSGGRATISMKKGEKLSNQSSDISSIHPLGHMLTSKFSIECKYYKDLYFEYTVHGLNNDFDDWWLKITVEAKQHNKSPMMIVKQNYKPDMIVVDKLGKKIFFPKGWRHFVYFGELNCYVSPLDLCLKASSPDMLGEL